LYQFYISEKKDEVIGKVVKSEDIPAATQLFTPNWIVKYLVQNTIGRQWLATYPDSSLRQHMEYYIEPAEQTEDVNAQLAAITPKTLDPEQLTLLDPACGSGHILVEAYDLFKAIYQERGFRSKDIPRLILEKNLFGLEIDDRAAQLAALALLMKARADDRRIITDHIQPNVLAIQESKELDELLQGEPWEESLLDENSLFPEMLKQPSLKQRQESRLDSIEPCLRELIKLFEHGKSFGSLIQLPPELVARLPEARQSIEALMAEPHLWKQRAATLLLPLMSQAVLLSNTYSVVVANPPYLGSKHMNPEIKQFASRNFPDGKADLFGMFALRLLPLVHLNHHLGLMTPFTWMFITSYEDLRQTLVNQNTLWSLIQPEYHAFFDSAYVPICTFVIQKADLDINGTFIDLSQFYGEELQPLKTLEAIRSPACDWRFCVGSHEFSKLPGSPIAYKIASAIRDAFVNYPPLSTFADARKGMVTGENSTYVRQWHEVSWNRIGFGVTSREQGVQSQKRWFPYAKGGEFRKWFGNLDAVVN
ncbi:MAG: BREX-1 system adenine-specific DNA-methyltransferase PglX, partial [Terriglobia bacterium]